MVSGLTEEQDGFVRKALVELEAHARVGSSGNRHDALSREVGGIRHRGLDCLGCQRRVARKSLFGSSTGREVVEDNGGHARVPRKQALPWQTLGSVVIWSCRLISMLLQGFGREPMRTWLDAESSAGR